MIEVASAGQELNIAQGREDRAGASIKRGVAGTSRFCLGQSNRRFSGI
jgi:hypothetical protein